MSTWHLQIAVLLTLISLVFSPVCDSDHVFVPCVNGGTGQCIEKTGSIPCGALCAAQEQQCCDEFGDNYTLIDCTQTTRSCVDTTITDVCESACNVNEETTCCRGIHEDELKHTWGTSLTLPYQDVYYFKRSGWDDGTREFMGGAVSIDGDYAIVGVQGHDPDNAGAAIIYHRDATSTIGKWAIQQWIYDSPRMAYDNFGESVGISGDYAIIGVKEHGSRRGIAYIFKRSGTTWGSQFELTFPDEGTYLFFGRSVAIDGDVAIVGSYMPRNETAFVYRRVGDDNVWVLEARLHKPERMVSNLDFAAVVDISGDYAIVGNIATSAPHPGGVCIFHRGGDGVWYDQVLLEDLISDPENRRAFGYSISIDGEWAVVGDPMQRLVPSSSWMGGAIYMFHFNGSNWVLQSKYGMGIDQYEHGQFLGSSVSISGDNILVGASGDEQYATRIFRRNSVGVWELQFRYWSLSQYQYSEVGYSASMSGAYAIVGAPRTRDTGTNNGAIYLFDGTPAQYTDFVYLDCASKCVAFTAGSPENLFSMCENECPGDENSCCENLYYGNSNMKWVECMGGCKDTAVSPTSDCAVCSGAEDSCCQEFYGGDPNYVWSKCLGDCIEITEFDDESKCGDVCAGNEDVCCTLDFHGEEIGTDYTWVECAKGCFENPTSSGCDDFCGHDLYECCAEFNGGDPNFLWVECLDDCVDVTVENAERLCATEDSCNVECCAMFSSDFIWIGCLGECKNESLTGEEVLCSTEESCGGVESDCCSDFNSDFVWVECLGECKDMTLVGEEELCSTEESCSGVENDCCSTFNPNFVWVECLGECKNITLLGQEELCSTEESCSGVENDCCSTFNPNFVWVECLDECKDKTLAGDGSLCGSESCNSFENECCATFKSDANFVWIDCANECKDKTVVGVGELCGGEEECNGFESECCAQFNQNFLWIECLGECKDPTLDDVDALCGSETCSGFENECCAKLNDENQEFIWLDCAGDCVDSSISDLSSRCSTFCNNGTEDDCCEVLEGDNWFWLDCQGECVDSSGFSPTLSCGEQICESDKDSCCVDYRDENWIWLDCAGRCQDKTVNNVTGLCRVVCEGNVSVCCGDMMNGKWIECSNSPEDSGCYESSKTAEEICPPVEDTDSEISDTDLISDEDTNGEGSLTNTTSIAVGVDSKTVVIIVQAIVIGVLLVVFVLLVVALVVWLVSSKKKEKSDSDVIKDVELKEKSSAKPAGVSEISPEGFSASLKVGAQSKIEFKSESVMIDGDNELMFKDIEKVSEVETDNQMMSWLKVKVAGNEHPVEIQYNRRNQDFKNQFIDNLRKTHE